MIQSKIDAIYKDISHNVTYIYDRDDMLLAFDLVFHSVLSFKFQGKSIHKGWVEGLIVSDTRCVSGDTVLFTDQGMKEIKDCVKGIKVGTLAENKKINRLYSFGKEEIIKIQTRRGFVLEGTGDHPILTSNGFKKLKDIKLDDFVGLRFNSNIFGKKKMSKEKARLYGYLIGDGCLTKNKRKNTARMCIHKNEKEVINNFEDCLNKLKITFKRYLSHDCWDYHFNRNTLNLPYCNAGNKSVPLEIMAGSKENNIEFLKGLFETDGHHSKQEVIEFSSKSYKLSSQVQLILLNLGILTTKTTKYTNGIAYYRIFISGNYTKIFLKEVGFISKRKNRLRKNIVHRTTLDTLPGLSSLINIVWQEYKKNFSKIDFSNNTIRQWRYGNRNPQRESLRKFLCCVKAVSYLKEYQQLKTFLNLSVSWDTIIKITPQEAVKVYDLNISIEHNFVSNGFISHNCGKSETSEKLVNHYKLGEICSAENTSFAGLVGGMQQVGSRWHLTWGKIPINDRRLIVIDELSGMSVDTIGLMSGVRSSGIAEIVKINTEKTHARTRIAWLSNPRSNISVQSHNSGIDILRHLVGRPEDIARFDFALIMSNEEVSSEVINAYQREVVEHIYTDKLCHNLILWAWSRKENQIDIPDETVKTILNETKRLCSKYSAEFPLVTTSEMKIKLARLSIALAARLFSTKDGETVLVLPEHVEYIAKWLDKIYSRPCFAYDAWSARAKERNTVDRVAVEELLYSKPLQLRECLLEMGQIRVTDVEEILPNGDRKEAKDIVSRLMSYRAVQKIHGFYVKTPEFIKILRSMGNTQTVDIQEDYVDRE